MLCISWTIKCLFIIDARCKHEDQCAMFAGSLTTIRNGMTDSLGMNIVVLVVSHSALLFNFLQSIITTWRNRVLVRCERLGRYGREVMHCGKCVTF